jgi:ankyrin repeat protein
VDGWTPLSLAAFFGQRQAVWTLLTHDADVSAVSRSPQQNTALHAAIAGVMNRHGNELPITYLLISRGAPVSARDSGGNTPLHIAAGSGSQALILGLLGAGADISARDTAGFTPLGIALSRDQQGAADLLRQMGSPE